MKNRATHGKSKKDSGIKDMTFFPKKAESQLAELSTKLKELERSDWIGSV